MSEQLASMARQFLAAIGQAADSPQAAPVAEPEAPAPAPALAPAPQIDMSQLEESPPTLTPAPPQRDAFDSMPPSRPVPVSDAGDAYTAQDQDERRRIYRDAATADNALVDSTKLGIQAANEKAAEKATESKLQQFALDEDAQSQHESAAAYDLANKHNHEAIMLSDTLTQENLAALRQQAMQRPTGVWDSSDNRAKAMGIVNVLFAAPQGLPAMVGSLNRLFAVDSAQQVAHENAVKEYGLALNKNQEILNQRLVNEKSAVEAGIAVRKEATASEIRAIANRLGPSVAKTEALQTASELMKSYSASVTAAKHYQAQDIAENSKLDSDRYKNITGRITANAEADKVKASSAENTGRQSDEMIRGDGQPWRKDDLTADENKQVIAAKSAFHLIDSAEKDLKKGGLSGLRLQQIDEAALVYNVATAVGITRHDIHTMDQVKEFLGLGPKNKLWNDMTGVEQRDVLRKLKGQMRNTIKLTYQQVDPNASPRAGGYVDRTEKEDLKLRAIDEVENASGMSAGDRLTALKKLNAQLMGENSKEVDVDIAAAAKRLKDG